MALIGKEDIELVLGNIVAKNDYSTDRVLPFAVIGEDNWLKPEIGEDLYDKLVEATADDFDDTEGGDWAKLLGMVKKVCVWAAYLEYLPFAIGTDTGNGLTEEVSEGSKPVRIGLLEKRISTSKVNLGKEIDRVMEFLFLKRDIYTDWAESAAGMAALGLIVRSGTELKKVLPPATGYWLWKSLRGWLEVDTEELLVGVLGKDLYVKLMGDLADDALTGKYVELRWKAASYVSWAVYEKVLPAMVVVQTDDGALRVLSEFDGINNRKTATEEQLSMLMRGIMTHVGDALERLKRYLVENADDIAEYEVVVSDTAGLLNKPRFMRNESKRSVFGV